MTQNTTTIKKVTKNQRFDDIKALLKGETVMYNTTVEDAIAFIEYEQSLLAKKNTSTGKPTETQKTNITLTEQVIALLKESGKGMTATEVFRGVPELFENYSTNKAAYLLNAAWKAGLINKTTEKGKALFSV